MKWGVLAASIAGLAVVPTAWGATPLVLQRSDAPGLKASPATIAGGKRAAAAAVRPARLPPVRGGAEVAHFSGAGVDLWSITYTLRTPPAAQAYTTSALKALQRRKIRSRAARVGERGWAIGPVQRRATVLVLWRRGPVVGEIVLRAREAPGPLRQLARSYARVVDGRIARDLGLDDWERTLEQIRPNGTIPRKTALDLFALAFGPLPGTRPPKIRRPSREEEGTLAENAILEVWSTLTPAQRRVALQRMGLKRYVPGRRTRRVTQPAPCPPTGPPPPTYGDPTFTPDATLQALAERWRDKFAANLGRPLTLCIVAGYTTAEFPAADGTPAAAVSRGIEPDGTVSDRATVCRIRVTAFGRTVLDGPQRHRIVAHEVFHCFQYMIMGATRVTPAPDWLIEGSAEWAAIRATGIEFEEVTGSLGTYFYTCADRPLFARTYDASGFFGHVEDVSGELWPFIDDVLNAFSNDRAYFTAGAHHPTFLNSWASSTLLKPWGLDWYQRQPTHIPPHAACLTTPLAGSGTVKANPYTLHLYEIPPAAIDPAKPLLHVEVARNARLGNGDIDTTDLSNAWFCLLEVCECPPGQEGDLPPAAILELPAYLALTGHVDGTSGIVNLVSLDEFCHEREGPPDPPRDRELRGGCSTGCGSSHGDPHLVGFDGGFFDFHAAGEFVLAKSKVDGFEVQARQEPVSGTGTLANNTAIAMRVEGDRVGVYRGKPLRVLVNGLGFLPAKVFRRLPRGGRLRLVESDQVEIVWTDGTFARVYPLGNATGVVVLIKPSLARRGTLTGLLGNFDGRSGNDLITRNGRVLDLVRTPRSYRLLYRVLGESWRITQRASLFDYAPGQSTRTFTNRRYPRRIVNLAQMDAQARRAAVRACGRMRIRTVALLRACEVDVTATGDNRYATSAGRLNRIARRFGKPPRSRGEGSGAAVSRWTAVATSGTSRNIVPSLRVLGDDVVAAYQTAPGAAESVTFVPSASADARNIRRTSLVTGWTALVSNPVLLPRPSGGLQALLSGFHSAAPSDPLRGTVLVERRVDGSWAPPAPVTTDSRSYVGSSAVLAPSGDPIWASGVTGLRLWQGTSAPRMVDLAPFVPRGTHILPAVGRDGLGRYWLGWYVSTAAAGERGLYLLQFDPGTLQPVGRPQHAPGSSSFASLSPQVAFACARLCRLVYLSEQNQIVSWAYGEGVSTRVTLAPRGRVLGSVAAAYTSRGRLWVAWVDLRTASYSAKLGNAEGSGGKAVALAQPPSGRSAGQPGVVAVGDQLVVVLNWAARGQNTRYVNVVPPAG